MPKPTAQVLFYDSDCGICTASITWLRPRLPESASLRMIPYQDPEAPEKYPQIDWGHTDLGVQAILSDGSVLLDSQAVAACLRLIPTWKWLGEMMRWPLCRQASQIGYLLVARNRLTISRWLGLDACKIPSRK